MRWKILLICPSIFFFASTARLVALDSDQLFVHLFKQKSKFMEFEDLDKSKSISSEGNATEPLNKETIPPKNVQLLSPSLSKLELAKKTYLDGSFEEAITLFLESLQPQKSHSLYIPTAEEQEHYQRALNIYLESKDDKLHQGSVKIVSAFAPIVKAHPEFCQLGFIVAAAYANQGDYLHYFDFFHHAYSLNPDHYLSHKIQAVLWIKLFEKEDAGKVKEGYRKRVIEHLGLASSIYPNDTSLCKLMILYASDKKRSQIILEVLNKIIQSDIMIPRTDLEFYIQKALTVEDLVVVQKFVDKVGEWYQFNKVVKAADEYIKNRRAEERL